MIIFKNFFSFALTFKAYDWIIERGIRPPMIAISSVQVVVCLLSIPMCKSTARPCVVVSFARPFILTLRQTSMGSACGPISTSTTSWS